MTVGELRWLGPPPKGYFRNEQARRASKLETEEETVMPRLALHVAVALLTFLVGLCAAGLRGAFVNDCAAKASPAVLRAEARASDDEAEVLSLMRQYAEAQTRHDESFFERAEADSYTVYMRGGGALTKSQVIPMMKGWDMRTVYAHEELRVQLVGDVAIVTGWMRATRTDNADYSQRWQSVYILRKSEGRWQILSATQANEPTWKR